MCAALKAAKHTGQTRRPLSHDNKYFSAPAKHLLACDAIWKRSLSDRVAAKQNAFKNHVSWALACIWRENCLCFLIGSKHAQISTFDGKDLPFNTSRAKLSLYSLSTHHTRHWARRRPLSSRGHLARKSLVSIFLLARIPSHKLARERKASSRQIGLHSTTPQNS